MPNVSFKNAEKFFISFFPFVVLNRNIPVLSTFFLTLFLANQCLAQVHNYGQWTIPYNPSPKPNKDTLEFHLKRYLDDYTKFGAYQSSKSSKPYVFEKKLRREQQIDEALKKTSLLSYLLYEEGKISIDELSPTDRFGKIVNNDTKFFSMSIGKSMTSYVLAHAICGGIIEGINHTVSDWSILDGTLYQQATILDLINMRAGDQLYVNENKGFIKASGQQSNPNNQSVRSSIQAELKNTRSDKPYFNYNSMPPNIVLNYVIYRSEGSFDKLLNKIFQDKVRTEQNVFFLKQRAGHEADGLARATFYATRYDYLRIAKAMLDDWKENTCEGRYLKEIIKQRKPKEGQQMKFSVPNGSFWAFRGYGGFFHTDFYSFKKNRNVISMLGNGDQIIMIDFDNSRIVSTHAIHNDFEWKRLVSDVISTGKMRK